MAKLRNTLHKRIFLSQNWKRTAIEVLMERSYKSGHASKLNLYLRSRKKNKLCDKIEGTARKKENEEN
jgi:hypothetical protein